MEIGLEKEMINQPRVGPTLNNSTASGVYAYDDDDTDEMKTKPVAEIDHIFLGTPRLAYKSRGVAVALSTRNVTNPRNKDCRYLPRHTQIRC